MNISAFDKFEEELVYTTTTCMFSSSHLVISTVTPLYQSVQTSAAATTVLEPHLTLSLYGVISSRSLQYKNHSHFSTERSPTLSLLSYLKLFASLATLINYKNNNFLCSDTLIFIL